MTKTNSKNNMKPYITPHIDVAHVKHEYIIAASLNGVESNNQLNYGSGAGGSVIQRTRAADQWFGKDFTPFSGENSPSGGSFTPFGDE